MFPQITSMANPQVDDNAFDKIMWKSIDGRIYEFSTKQAYYEMSIQWPKVGWRNLIWFSQSIPKHSFILWLAINEKLMTHDRMKKWGTYDMMVCTLCKKDEESHNHLFFDYDFSQNIWNGICKMIKLNNSHKDWECTIDDFATKPNANSI
ncbi:reverse transcriptase zinc-binding domain-containing protein [Tanacetum coccineum]